STMAGVIASLARRDALLQFDDLEAALPLLPFLAGGGGLLRLILTWVHNGTSFRAVCGITEWSSPSLQTKRPGDARAGAATVTAAVIAALGRMSEQRTRTLSWKHFPWSL